MTYLWNQHNFDSKPDRDIIEENYLPISLMNIDAKNLKKKINWIQQYIIYHNQVGIQERKVSFFFFFLIL